LQEYRFNRFTTFFELLQSLLWSEIYDFRPTILIEREQRVMQRLRVDIRCGTAGFRLELIPIENKAGMTKRDDAWNSSLRRKQEFQIDWAGFCNLPVSVCLTKIVMGGTKSAIIS
jgi:hypothetical protein